MTYRFTKLKNMDLMVYRCACGELNIIGFCTDVEWTVEGDFLVHCRTCAKCHAPIVRREPAYLVNPCESIYCSGEGCKACHDVLMTECGSD